VTKEETIAAVQECAEQLGHVPTVEEVLRGTKVDRYSIRKHFGSYREVLKACRLERHGCGYEVSLESLFVEWAGMVRELGRVPTIGEYEVRSKYSLRPLLRHYGGWRQVPNGLAGYARGQHLDDQWKDVLDVVANQERSHGGRVRTSVSTSGMRTSTSVLTDQVLTDQMVYGPPMNAGPLVYAPTNEAGVMFLFGSVAKELGFAVTHIQTGFPDCEAMREVEPGRWQLRRIEVEYESRNFLLHQHAADKCDLIVCWRHNWEECPLEVLELKRAISDQRSAVS
jgi:hypothetical protein